MSPAAVITKHPVNGIAAVPATQPPAPTPRIFEANSTSGMVHEIIRKHWRSLEASHKASAWGALEGGYSDARRAYHSWEHIAELLEKLDEFRALSAKPELVATAVFWHDAVYATRAPDGGKRSDLENVRDSAELFLRHTLLNAHDAAAVHELIMATADHTRAEPKKAHYDGFAGDLDLLLDLDLSSSRRAVEDLRGESRKYSLRIRLGSRAGVLFEPNRSARRLSEGRRAPFPAGRNEKEVARGGKGQSDVLYRRIVGETRVALRGSRRYRPPGASSARREHSRLPRQRPRETAEAFLTLPGKARNAR